MVAEITEMEVELGTEEFDVFQELFTKSYRNYNRINKKQLSRLAKLAKNTLHRTDPSGKCWIATFEISSFFSIVCNDPRLLLTYCKVTANQAMVSSLNLPYFTIVPNKATTPFGEVYRTISKKEAQIIEEHFRVSMDLFGTDDLTITLRSTEDNDTRILAQAVILYDKKNLPYSRYIERNPFMDINDLYKLVMTLARVVY